MKRKFFAVFTALTMAILLIPIFSVSAEEYTGTQYGSTGLYYTKYDTYCEITDCNTSVTSVTIPEVIEDLPVTSIGMKAFQYCTALTKIEIPQGIEIINNNAFSSCSALSYITLPEQNISIGNEAFYNTAYYNKNENWDDGILYIGKHLITANSYVTGNLIIKDGTLTIAERTFQNNTNITAVQFPSSLLRVGEYAFYGCTQLREVAIPESIADIEEYAFGRCTSITNATINCDTIGKRMFDDCTRLTNVTFGDKVKSIGEYAFGGCISLSSITVPKNVEIIGKGSFRDCSALSDISILNDNIKMESSVFYKCSSITNIDFLPKNITSIGDYCFFQCNGLVNLVVPSHITNIGASAFFNCSNLKTVKLPDGVTALGDNAFNQCRKLEYIYIPKSVTNIGERSLYYLSNIKRIDYEGTEAEWNAVSKGLYNDAIKDDVMNYNYIHKTTTTVNGSTFTITGNYIDGCTVIFALYKEDDKGGNQLVDCQTAVYDGNAKTFTTTATDYTSAKVMVWSNLTNIEPVTEVEIVNLGQSN